MTQLKFSQHANDSLDHLHSTDSMLAEAIEEALDLIEYEYPKARARSTRVEQDKVFILQVFVRGRDDTYWVVWWGLDEAKVWVEHVGKSRG